MWINWIQLNKQTVPRDWNNLKLDVDTLDVDNVKIDPIGFKKFSDAVYNDVAQKTFYNKLVPKVLKLKLVVQLSPLKNHNIILTNKILKIDWRCW